MEKEFTGKSKKAVPPTSSEPIAAEVPANGKPSGVRGASDEQFKKAQRKTSALHAGLFRRLGE